VLRRLPERRFGSAEVALERLRKLQEINRLEPEMKAMTDEELRTKTEELRTRRQRGVG